MASPRLGFTELTTGQAVPETTVNEMLRYAEQGAIRFTVKDKDLTTAPGSPSDGDCYIVASGATGTWAGKDGKLAFRMSTSWNYITPTEGFRAYIQDEDKEYNHDGTSWSDVGASNSQVWTGSSTDKYLTPAVLYTAAAPVALTSGTTITPDGNSGFNFSLTLGHNATLANPSNFKTGQSGVIVITQDGTGSRTMTYGSQWKFPGGAPVLSTTAGAVDLLAYFVSSSGSQIVATLTKAYSS